ncbi:hypothetical protein [Rheinheimera sp.]|uniref:hypothetical protein n=1 Tax=Rheinheimera sp. TaxID=1869214 RepID=UPI00307DE4E9
MLNIITVTAEFRFWCAEHQSRLILDHKNRIYCSASLCGPENTVMENAQQKQQPFVFFDNHFYLPVTFLQQLKPRTAPLNELLGWMESEQKFPAQFVSDSPQSDVV